MASNYASSYTTTFADLGGAVLLALSATSTATYRKGLEVGWADALAAGVAPAPVPQPVAQPVAQRQQFMVQIPAGVAPGAVMTVRAPDGRLLQVQVPAGAVPGSTIQVAA